MDLQLTLFHWSPQVGCICDDAVCDKIIKHLLPKLALSTQVCGHFLRHHCLDDQFEQLVTVLSEWIGKGIHRGSESIDGRVLSVCI